MTEPPRKRGRPRKEPEKAAGPRKLKHGEKPDWVNKFLPQAGAPAIYRNIATPLEFMLLMMNDESLSLPGRAWAASQALPYMHSKPAPRPHIPTEEERRAALQKRTLTVRIVDNWADEDSA